MVFKKGLFYFFLTKTFYLIILTFFLAATQLLLADPTQHTSMTPRRRIHCLKA